MTKNNEPIEEVEDEEEEIISLEEDEMPVVGEQFYVPNAFFIDKSEDDFVGGLATISKVTVKVIDRFETPMLEMKERPGKSYNFWYLSDLQDELKDEFGKGLAHLDPNE